MSRRIRRKEMTAGARLEGAFVHRRRKEAGGRRVPGKMGRPGPLCGEAKLGRGPGREKKKKKGMGCAGRRGKAGPK